MASKILTKNQSVAFNALASSPLLNSFYFTGGTALAHFYLQHRKSEDLDFFSENEVDTQGIFAQIKKLKPKIKYTSIDIQTSFNRNIFHLRYSNKKSLKLEFTYFPFPQIQKPKVKQKVKVDSLIDIATNKLFTIAQKPRGRDYYDLYFIEKKKSYGLEKLRKLAKQKFDWHVDPLQLGSKLNQVQEHLDDPILTKNLPKTKLVKFFKKQAQSLKSSILK